MSASLKTTNYELGIYAPNDVTSWLTDFNGNMNKIDAQMKENENSVNGVEGDVAALTQRVTTTENAIESLENEYASVLNKITYQTIMLTPSSNSTSIGNLTISVLNLYFINLYANINKTGNKLSVINFNDDTKLVPVALATGNAFNLEIVSTPTPENITGLNSSIASVTMDSTSSLEQYASVVYFNGTNTIIGILLQNNSLTESFTLKTVSLSSLLTSD